jgi:hypothetical protein
MGDRAIDCHGAGEGLCDLGRRRFRRAGVRRIVAGGDGKCGDENWYQGESSIHGMSILTVFIDVHVRPEV